LGSTCEFHSADPEELQRQIGICREFVTLAQDVGAVGVKVRPNALQVDKGVPEEQTLEQIGVSLRECGTFAAEHGVEIWVEVHGADTCHPPRMRAIMDHCGHPQVGICWNSNDQDMLDGSVRPYFELLQDFIRSCHITELAREVYPYHELFGLLKGIGYDRFTLAEIADSADPERLMRYYRALWLALQA
jgi:sugar phosphate isomerase/epimerase